MIRINDVEKDLKFYEEYLGKVRIEINKLRKQFPEGAKLYASKHRNKYQYYVRKNGEPDIKTYISRENINMASGRAQLEYFEILEQMLDKRLMRLKKLKDLLSEDPFEMAEKKMSPGKQELIKAIYIPDMRYIREWKEQEYEKMGFKTESPEFYTRNGLRVRSKSEVIIADMLDEMNIPFLYEKPLKLRSVTVHPDFTLLDVNNRQEIYWEHLGMMDDADYRNNAFCKMREYEESGIYQHDRLIWTFETGRQPLDTRALRGMIKRLVAMLGYEGR